jgi:hypothetical protein
MLLTYLVFFIFYGAMSVTYFIFLYHATMLLTYLVFFIFYGAISVTYLLVFFSYVSDLLYVLYFSDKPQQEQIKSPTDGVTASSGMNYT